ncbi:MAG TPA: hypothetical protein VFC19_51530 [Candidatus Limnocylindrales bacterium]|nr:hypothetical protein [Candidatus Limnocylindrales bacterium]
MTRNVFSDDRWERIELVPEVVVHLDDAVPVARYEDLLLAVAVEVARRELVAVIGQGPVRLRIGRLTGVLEDRG